MPSLIPGYNYDIFISYRQNDNKYDGWVKEFIENLDKELEATSKDKINIYFDTNPHDGLLETHLVSSSLEDKLRCLIFIPILSRTYCDPSCFAWTNEFLGFKKIAESDRFGLNIKLASGNFASRILPVRIHDLEPEDIKLVESQLGFIRSVDFVFKSSGVNRPLRAHEDSPHENLNKTHYRDQINKVANNIYDIIRGIKKISSSENTEYTGISKSADTFTGEKEIVSATVKTNDKSAIHEEQLNESKDVKSRRKRKWTTSFISIILFIVLIGSLIVFNRSRQKKVLEKIIPEIEGYVSERNFSAAFKLFEKNEKYLAKYPVYKDLESRVTKRLTILSDPVGARVYMKEYSDTNDQWKDLGSTPLEGVRIPGFSYFTTGFTGYIVRFEKDGYEDVFCVTLGTPDTLFRKLFTNDSIPEGMIYVEGYAEEEARSFLRKKNGFFLDRNEVTNKQYKEFIDKGGYDNQAYWKNRFVKDGTVISWEEAISEFKDKTGRPGPSSWKAGGYPEGEDDYPVSGVSWYEAAAYAEYAGKELPSSIHWGSGAGFYLPYFTAYFNSKICLSSNFLGTGALPVGSLRNLNCFGTHDMAGNVREWCWNETEKGRIIRGGAWDDVSYMYSNLSQLPPFNRSERNGFRCARYINRNRIPESAFQPVSFRESRNYYSEKPVSDEIFTIYKNQFQYDKIPLNPIVEIKDESHDEFSIERITIDTPFEGGRETLYLFLPRKTVPPYQTIVFFPGSAVQNEESLLSSEYTKWYVEYLVKNGRAVVFPVYKGTFERKYSINPVAPSHQHVEWIIDIGKELSRSIDYLETRKEIDINRIGYYGVSWGGHLGAIFPAVENRLKLSILLKGGFPKTIVNPAVEHLNYITRITIPVLMMNGKYDVTFPIETNVKPFYDLLGTPVGDKRLCEYDTDHNIPRDEQIKETLAWLDKYFGSVTHISTR